ncbi:hypothetical protein [Candidatus Tisiphia endosymbiont of Sialis lutaria]|uniref:hypothetical protein n=1 Tax=Candidatus Tisiphia endosymbiont of Sialis lutaria TaxID=2029164 RepID=UPI00312C74F5
MMNKKFAYQTSISETTQVGRGNPFILSWIASFGLHASSLTDVSPGNCCKIARIDRISSLFNDDGDSRLWM